MSSVQEIGSEGWFLDYGLADEIQAADYIWTPHIMDDLMVASGVNHEFDSSRKENNSLDNNCARKRHRVESSGAPGTKACREKRRRDQLNDRFAELLSILKPGTSPKADKVVILSNATRLLKLLRLEAEKLRESNKGLKDGIENLRKEKMELRDEKVRLKAEKDKVEQMVKGAANIVPALISHPAAVLAPFPALHLATCNKTTLPSPNYYPSIGMWQWLPSTALDTSQDYALWPPVA